MGFCLFVLAWTFNVSELALRGASLTTKDVLFTGKPRGTRLACAVATHEKFRKISDTVSKAAANALETL